MNNGRSVVLVVEDSALIRMGAVDLVLSAGYEALEAQDADEAIRILESRDDIDLVFTDVQMPGTMDGIKLAHYIRDRWPPVSCLWHLERRSWKKAVCRLEASSSRNPIATRPSPTPWRGCWEGEGLLASDQPTPNAPWFEQTLIRQMEDTSCGCGGSLKVASQIGRNSSRRANVPLDL